MHLQTQTWQGLLGALGSWEKQRASSRGFGGSKPRRHFDFAHLASGRMKEKVSAVDLSRQVCGNLLLQQLEEMDTLLFFPGNQMK